MRTGISESSVSGRCEAPLVGSVLSRAWGGLLIIHFLSLCGVQVDIQNPNPTYTNSVLRHPSECGVRESAGQDENPKTTLNNGYLGSRNDEERSEMRYVV